MHCFSEDYEAVAHLLFTTGLQNITETAAARQAIEHRHYVFLEFLQTRFDRRGGIA